MATGGLPLLHVSGLQTAPNPFSGAPEGGLAVAKNVLLASSGVAEPRRGWRAASYTFTAPSTGLSSAATFFGDSLVFHFDGTSLAYDTGSAFSTYSGTFAAVDDTLLRMKFAEAKQNLYFNTAAGVKVLESATGTVRASGLPRPLVTVSAYFDGTGTNLTLPGLYKGAARTTYFYTDSNGNEIESAPSFRGLADNISSDSENHLFDFTAQTVPSETKFRLYGNTPIPRAGDPGDELYLFTEVTPATSYLAKVLALSSYPLYTNAQNGFGIGQANEQPPVCKDLAWWKNRMWFGNTTSRHRFFLRVLGTGPDSGIQSGDTITVAGVTFTATTSAPTTYQFYAPTSGSVSENITAAGYSLAKQLNAQYATTGVTAYYLPTGAADPGQLILESSTLGAAEFTVYASRAASWNPELPSTAGTALASDNFALKNGLYFSRQDLPEAVPGLNYLLVGAKNKELLRVVPLGDKLFVFKDDGVFTVAGDEPFNLDLLDSTCRVVAPDSVVVLENTIFAFTTKGVVTVTAAGVHPISRSIEDELLPYLHPSQRATIRRYGFGVAHEADRTYELWLPSPGGSDSRASGKAFVFNVATKTWATWEGEERTWGAVGPTDRRYYGALSGTVVAERRDFASSDYADGSFTAVVSAYTGTTLTVSSSAAMTVGDALIHTKGGTEQAVTITAITNATTITVSEAILTALQSGATVTVDTAFESTVTWLPVAFERPGSEKRFQFGTLHFGRPTYFDTAYATYATEISSADSNEDASPITMVGWGVEAWGEFPWGQPVKNFNARHIIPAEKQRAAMLYPGFTIREARSRWTLHGLTLDTGETSERTGK